MARLPTNKDASERLRQAVEAVGQVNFGRLVDQSRLVNDALKCGQLDQVKKAGENITRILDSITPPATTFRTDQHKLLEAIGKPLYGPTIKGPAFQNAPVSAQERKIGTTADIGKMVREARKAMGMTQQRFADLSGVGRRFLSELEGGKASLELGRVLAVCKAAGIDLFARHR